MLRPQVLKIVAMVVAFAALICVFTACTDSDTAATIKEYRVAETEFNVGDTFTPASVTINALLTDGTVKTLKSDLVVFPIDYKTTLKLTKDDNNGSEVWKFSEAGTFNLTVNYLGDEIDVAVVVR